MLKMIEVVVGAVLFSIFPMDHLNMVVGHISLRLGCLSLMVHKQPKQFVK